MILIAVHQPREPKVPSDVPKEQLGRIAPDLSSAAGREPDVRDQQESKAQGTAGNQEKPAEYVSEGDPVCEGAHEPVQSGGSVGALVFHHLLTTY